MVLTSFDIVSRPASIITPEPPPIKSQQVMLIGVYTPYWYISCKRNDGCCPICYHGWNWTGLNFLYNKDNNNTIIHKKKLANDVLPLHLCTDWYAAPYCALQCNLWPIGIEDSHTESRFNHGGRGELMAQCLKLLCVFEVSQLCKHKGKSQDSNYEYLIHIIMHTLFCCSNHFIICINEDQD